MENDAKYLTLNAENFEGEVLQSAQPVLVDFWAEWCGPCRAIAPKIEQLAADLEGQATVAKLNVDEHPELATRYGIQAIPSFLIFRDGQVVDQIVGAVPKEELENRLKSLLSAA